MTPETSFVQDCARCRRTGWRTASGLCGRCEAEGEAAAPAVRTTPVAYSGVGTTIGEVTFHGPRADGHPDDGSTR